MKKVESSAPKLEVVNYTEVSGGSSPATVAFADNGTDFTVKSEQACAVMLLKADGTVQTLKAPPSGDAYAFSAEGAAEGDQVVVALKGDTNLDGKHTAADAVMAKAAALGKLTPSPVQEAVANVNGDSKITAADAVMIKAITLGKTEAKW